MCGCSTARRGGLSLTESGSAFYERCVHLLADLDEAEQSASASSITPRGTLRLSASVTFGERHLAPAIGAFIERFPDMRFDVELSDRAVDLVDEGFDAAVRIGAIGSQNLVGRTVAATSMVCCAAPEYLRRRGEPKRPDDLSGHECLTYEYASQRNTWLFRERDGSARQVKVSGPVNANSGRFLATLALEGLGIAYEPDFIVGPDVRAGRLIPILRAFQPSPSTIQLVYPSRRHLSAKVRAFADFLRERFDKAEWALQLAGGAGRRCAALEAGFRHAYGSLILPGGGGRPAPRPGVAPGTRIEEEAWRRISCSSRIARSTPSLAASPYFCDRFTQRRRRNVEADRQRSYIGQDLCFPRVDGRPGLVGTAVAGHRYQNAYGPGGPIGIDLLAIERGRVHFHVRRTQSGVAGHGNYLVVGFNR